ncbi:hypothetical protein [Pontimicrobium sp. IMCC45349]|uniref:hypothetical protein n=1 Tax=Pontimicrobium sp. IMCC45349 TaxID=3391574 RepID=UPI0039A3E02D
MLKKIIQNIIRENNKAPEAVQCLWYSDVNYLALDVELVFKTKKGYEKKRVSTLNYMDFENQKELSEEAERIGKTLAKKYNAEFYFPSPNEWSRDCPDWWKSKKAFKCEDCETPIIQTDSKYLPKKICYPCHLKREQNERLKNDQTTEDRYSFYNINLEELPILSYSTSLENLIVYQYLDKKEIENNFIGNFGTYNIDRNKLIELKTKLENEIDKILLKYNKPELPKRISKLSGTTNIIYKKVKYELFSHFDRNLIHLISNYNDYQKAINEEQQYKLFGLKEITKRDDSILRYINYKCKGECKVNEVIENYNDVISKNEVKETLERLVEVGCLLSQNNKVQITSDGKSII